MSVKSEVCIKDLPFKKPRKFPLGCDVDKEEIFDFPYLADETTISFLKNYGRIMFIIRGPNSTLKSYLSELIMKHYPSSKLCCADHYFSQTFSPPTRTKETIKLSHDYCHKKVEDSLKKSEGPIIVQNTHMRKWELQIYLDIAAVYNYAVIMSITLYKFNVTAEALEKINPDGLNVHYFRNRLRQWQDIPPLFTGWFLSPSDSAFVLKSLQKTLSVLLDDGKFCRVFDCYDNDTVWDYFLCRRNLYCVAGFSSNASSMKDYYLSDPVQACYGKCYYITLTSYLITQSSVIGIVHIDEEMKYLEFRDNHNYDENICEPFNLMELNDNISEYKTLYPFLHEDVSSQENNVEMNDWLENEVLDLKNSRLIHLAQSKTEPEQFDIRKIENRLYEKLNSLNDVINFTEYEDISVSRLPEDEWLVKLPKKMKIKTLFTGLYI